MSTHHWLRLLVTCWVFTSCVVWNRSDSWSTTQSWVFLGPEWAVQVLTWSPKTSRTNFLQPQAEIDRSTRTGICVPTQVAKKVCQRLEDQTSSRRCGLLIIPTKTRGLYHRIRFGVSSSWDSRHPSPYKIRSLLLWPRYTVVCSGKAVHRDDRPERSVWVL